MDVRSVGVLRGLSDEVIEGLDRDVVVGQAYCGGFQCFAVVVDLGVVVEHHQALRCVRGEREFDGVPEVVDAGDDRDRFGLDEDRVQLLHRSICLQRNRDGSGKRQRHIHDRVVGTGEPERCDTVAGPYRVVGQCVGEGAHTSPCLAVGQGVESRLQRGNSASVCIGDEFDGALAQRGPVGIAVHHGADHVGQYHAGAVEYGGDRWIGLGGNELRVA